MKKNSQKVVFLLLIPLVFLFFACEKKAETNQFVTNNPACNYSSLSDSDMQLMQNYIKEPTMKLKPEKGDQIATIQTNYGELKMLLYTEKAPLTTTNFIELSKSGKYDKTAIHRSIDCFMIQGGDFEKQNGTGGYSYKGPGTVVPDEFTRDLKHLRGSVSMANRGPMTAGSQFFIVQADYGTPWLDGKHTVFGFIYEGMDAVDKITALETDGSDRPVENVLIEKITISEAK